ncbi:MAG TPA: SDR family oxidoreductase [Roseiflexaceae bacterium]|nr:SDR family oxidoreductase [Roseiflexaceae bacterium]
MTNTRQTALITGASGGIGEELARIFAARGFNLALVARTESKLRALGSELAHQHGVSAAVFAADLADPAAPPQLAERLAVAGVTVDVLVNNAGFATYGNFAELDIDGELRLLQVNIVALSHLTRLLLPGMIQRGRGRILNVASTAAFMPGPLMADYYASKAFVLSFSEALNNELSGTGVSVTVLCPGPTSTGFQARAQMEQSKLVSGRAIMDAATVARAGFEGLMRERPVVIPGLMNRIQTFLPRLLPRAFVPAIVRQAQELAH